MPTVTIRVLDSDLAEWTAAANLRGMSISEWIRRRCNLAVFQSGSEQHNGNEANQDVSRIRAGSIRERRTTAAGRGNSRANGSKNASGGIELPTGNSSATVSTADRRGHQRGTGTLRAIEDIAYNTNRASGIGNESTPPLETTPSTAGEGLTAAPFVVHKATSNRLTCLCNTCVSWRKTNDIPIGGAPKKEKKGWSRV